MPKVVGAEVEGEAVVVAAALLQAAVVATQVVVVHQRAVAARRTPVVVRVEVPAALAAAGPAAASVQALVSEQARAATMPAALASVLKLAPNRAVERPEELQRAQAEPAVALEATLAVACALVRAANFLSFQTPAVKAEIAAPEPALAD